MDKYSCTEDRFKKNEIFNRLINMKHIQEISTAFFFLVFVFLLIFFSSCKTNSKVVYLQDIQSNIAIALQEVKEITLKPGDKLNIVVYSRDQELVKMFNLISMSEGNNSRENSYYTVNKEGQIDMPILGLISVEGLTRLEVADLIKYRLLAGKLLRDPTVTVEYANMYYYVMGEVGNPGKHEIEHDQITLLEALSEAGDLTIQGRRDNILVLRTVNGEQTPYRVDITQTEKLYGSPAFYLQQNDLIYVEPNTMRVNQSQLNANTLRTPGFWFSTTSFVLSLILLLTR